MKEEFENLFSLTVSEVEQDDDNVYQNFSPQILSGF